MKHRILENLTTTERLTLLEQIFAPGAGVRLEQSSCHLRDMEWMFDFNVVNLVENLYTYKTVKNMFDDLRNADADFWSTPELWPAVFHPCHHASRQQQQRAIHQGYATLH